MTSGENPVFISATAPEFLNSKGDPKLFSLGGELDSSLCSGEKCGPLQVEGTTGPSTSKEVCDWLWSRDTVGLSSISGDDSKLLPATSLSSGDRWERTCFEDSSDFSTTSINSSSWPGFANTLWSFGSGDDPTPPPLSPEGVLGISLSTGEESGLSCTGRGLDLSLDLGEDAVISS